MHHKSPVGASLLAMVVNDHVGNLTPRGALRFIASMLAPTERGGNCLFGSAIKNPANHGPGQEDGGYITFVRQA